jgi:omega-6 fatty acid desaturase (delta-12 desaturase)
VFACITAEEPIDASRGRCMVSTAEALRDCQRIIADRHVRPDNFKAFIQCCTTLLPLAALWWMVWFAAAESLWLLPVVLALMSLFLLRVFVLMHECGHGSLFRSASLNKAFGFIFGVVAGMPQFVWSQHHRYHHSTNGNWARYRGPMNIIAVDEYAALTARQQHRYRSVRNVWVSPVAGFLYLILNPRLTWIRGSVSLALHTIRRKGAEPDVSARSHMLDFTAAYCSSVQEYWHMLWNNVALLTLWAVMAWAIGPVLFFACYLSTLSLAGGVAIVLFTVQHNFEHSYASQDEGWDRNTAAIEGTSFLILPAWFN